MRRLLALTAVLLVACGTPSDGVTSTVPQGFAVSGWAHAGPTCPVVVYPPDPSCADRPVEGAVLVVVDAGGTEVTRVVTEADGSFRTALPPGVYTLVPQPVEGLMGTAPEQQITIVDGPVEAIDVAYDTGIR